MSLQGKVELKRVPIDTACCACRKDIPFGTIAFVNLDTNQALCHECGVARGMDSKQRATKIVAALELNADVKALNKLKKSYEEACVMLKKEVDLYRLGEFEKEIEKQRVNLMDMIERYLRTGTATAEEKELLKKIDHFLLSAKDRQAEIHQIINEHLSFYKIPFDQKRKRRLPPVGAEE